MILNWPLILPWLTLLAIVVVGLVLGSAHIYISRFYTQRRNDK